MPLLPLRYDFVVLASTEIFCPNHPLIYTIQIPLPSEMEVELSIEKIIILNDSSSFDSSPLYIISLTASPKSCPPPPYPLVPKSFDISHESSCRPLLPLLPKDDISVVTFLKILSILKGMGQRVS